MINNLKFKSLIALLDYFKDENVCKKELEISRWNGKICCPHCGHDKVYKTGERFKCANSDCYKKFSVISGTIFENTKIPLRTWYAAIYLITAHKKGISSCQLARDLNVTQKTAWFLLHRIRETMQDEAPELLANTVEVDETFIGGKNKNRHANKKVKQSQGRSTKDKTPVFGAVERGGKVIMEVVPNTKGRTLMPIMEKIIEKGSTVVSDEWGAYARLGKHYTHGVVKHNEGQYVDGAFHTNNIEGVWAIFKRGYIGIYHQMSKKHLNRYCHEFAYRYNTRKISDGDRFETILPKCKNYRLRYSDLIANVA
jgi:transposase-like protein